MLLIFQRRRSVVDHQNINIGGLAKNGVADVLEINDTNIPMAEGYLQPPEYLVGYWRRWLQNLPTAKLRVGLVWQGNRDHMADVFRSFPLKAYDPLGQLDDIQFISLQKGYGAEQIKDWSGLRPLIQLPDPYLVWFRKRGFPPGKLGEQMALALEIRTNGLESLVAGLVTRER